ncbi:hypothetical protein ACFWMU_23180 [Streptomyces sp. NPDC058357]|uniref:hypothetical protein n=1 Tax=unclassified Streptomyces TaxID=2593676 RepID=UPI0036574F30
MTTPTRATAQPTALIVPVRISAMAVNDRVREETFFRQAPHFPRPPSYREDPEPDFTTFDLDFQTLDSSDGVYLQWELPAAAVRGRADTARLEPAAGAAAAADPDAVVYPLLPNRWMVVRYHHPDTSTAADPPSATGWLLWSDHIDPDGGSPFPDPGATDNDEVAGATRYVGTAHSLDADGWKPQGGERFQPVTALGPGIPGFTVYQPYNSNILSFHDPLRTNGDKGDLLPAGTVSYLVVGWHQDPADDLLAPEALKSLLIFRDGEGSVPATPEELVAAGLRALNWTITPPAVPPAPAPQRDLYHGLLLGLPWQNTQHFPSDRPQAAGEVTYALGNSALDARSALPAATTLAPRDRLLHRAFAQDCLDAVATALDDGRDTLDAAALATWFLASQTGYRWQITDSPQQAGIKPPVKQNAQELALERDWLTRLNADQSAYDARLRDLAEAQTRLYDLWWLAGTDPAKQPPDFPARAGAQLDPEQPGTLAAQVKALRDECFGAQGLREKVPHGATTHELADAITAYASTRKLPAGRRLKRIPLPPYHQPTDPLVLIKGAGTPLTAYPTTPTPCRLPGQLIDHDEITGRPTTPPPAPTRFGELAADLTWAPLDGLLSEFRALEDLTRRVFAHWPPVPPDPTSPAPPELIQDAQTLGWKPVTAVGGTPLWPAPCVLWRQAWSPLMVLWTATIHPLPYLSGGTVPATEAAPVQNWAFDGARYLWRGTGALPEPPTLVGHSLLTDLPAFVLNGRVTQYLARRPDAPADLLRTLVEEAGDEICQTLDGVNAALARRIRSNHHEPLDGPAAALLSTRILVPAPSLPPDPAAQHFEPVRAGQIVLTRLSVVDRFGRSVNILDPMVPQQSPDPRLADSVKPNNDPAGHITGPLTAPRETPSKCVQLTPRLQQAARTRFDTVCARDDTTVINPDDDIPPENPGPLCGWLVPDRRASTLLVYGAGGEPLGELLATAPDDEHYQVDWTPLPGSPWLTREDVLGAPFAAAHPHLCGILGTVLGPGESGEAGWLRAYTELHGILDEGLLSIAPAHRGEDPAWSLVGGRPVAVVRARLGIELAASPLPAADWDRLLTGPAESDGNRLREIRWPVRLGDSTRPDDGLIGFFTADRDTPDQTATNYRQLYTPYPPGGTAGEYARGLDPATDPAVRARRADTTPTTGDHSLSWVTLLIDPWRSATATTAILPAVSARLPTACVDGPRSRLTVSLRIGPLLAGTIAPTTPGEADPQPAHGLALPKPSPRYGTWTWSERTPPHETPLWASLPINGPSTAVHPPDYPPDARTGHLTLTRPTPLPTGTSRPGPEDPQ